MNARPVYSYDADTISRSLVFKGSYQSENHSRVADVWKSEWDIYIVFYGRLRDVPAGTPWYVTEPELSGRERTLVQSMIL